MWGNFGAWVGIEGSLSSLETESADPASDVLPRSSLKLVVSEGTFLLLASMLANGVLVDKQKEKFLSRNQLVAWERAAGRPLFDLRLNISHVRPLDITTGHCSSILFTHPLQIMILY